MLLCNISASCENIIQMNLSLMNNLNIRQQLHNMNLVYLNSLGSKYDNCRSGAYKSDWSNIINWAVANNQIYHISHWIIKNVDNSC